MRIAIIAIVSAGTAAIALLLILLLPASSPSSGIGLQAQDASAATSTMPTIGGVDPQDAGSGPSPTPEMREEELGNFNAQEGPPDDDADDGSTRRSKRSLDHECRDFPGASFCPPPPPYGLRISISGDDDIRVSYVRSQWDGHSTHFYKFELHQASSENGSYSSYKSVRDSYSPANFYNVDAGYWYQARGVRCENSNYTNCGDWSAFTSPIELEDELPLPPAPSGFSARASSRTAVRLSWNSVSGTDGYEMDYRQGSSGAWRDVAGSTRRAYRTVTGLSCGTSYQFRVRANGDGRTYYDEWGAWSDTASATTHACPAAADPVISISGLAASLHKGQSDSFAVSASDLSSSSSYRIELEAEAGLAFNSGCTDRTYEKSFPSGRTSYSVPTRIYACSAGTHDIDAELKRGSTTEDSDSDSVRVTAPSIDIYGLASSLEKGESDAFTIAASGMRSSLSYKIVLETDSGLAFNAACSDDDLEYSVPRGRTSYSLRTTVYACSAGNHDVDAELKRGSTTDDSDSDSVRVTAAPDPEISISGLASSLHKGQSDSFTVSASDLSSSSSYSIALEAESGLAFDAGCTDTDFEYSVPSGRTSHSVNPIVYACAAGNHDVDAELKRGSTVDDTASDSVRVAAPEISISGLAVALAKGESDSFTVSASDLSSSSSYTIALQADSGLAFDAGCTDTDFEYSVPSGRTSHSVNPTVYACTAGNHDVDAELKRGSNIDDSASGSVRVTAPPNPEISISGLASSLKKGESDGFTVSASDLSSSSSYTIALQAEAGLAFDAACNNDGLEYSIPRGRTSYSASPTIYACTAGNHDVDAELKRGSTTDASASGPVNVYQPAIAVKWLEQSLKKGERDIFTIDATGMDPGSSYVISVRAEAGLAFDAACSKRTYEKTVPRGRTAYETYPTIYACSAGNHDVDAELKRGTAVDDTASDSVRVAAPEISISGLAAALNKGESDSFTVSASDLSSSSSYKIALEAEAGLAFDAACNNDGLEYSVPNGRTSHSVNPTVYACAAGNHDVDAELKRGSTTEDSDSDSVRVTAPPDPEISISGLASSLKKGESDGFTVSASDLSSSSSYTIALQAGSGLAFDAACNDDELEYSIPRGRTSYSASPTVYACAAGSHDVDVELKRGSTTDASASGSVNVYQPSIAVKWLKQSLKKGERDIFTIDATGMDPGSSYVISVRAEAGLAFDAACSKRTYEKTVPRRRTAYETHPTIYACSTGSHDIDAELERGTAVDDTASGSIDVHDPSIIVKWLEDSLNKGQSDPFTLSVSGLSPSHSYKIVVRSDAGLAFDAACTVREREYAVSRGIAAHSVHTTIYACSAGSHRIDAQLKRGSTVDDTAFGSMRVAANIPGRGTAATLVPGPTDGSVKVSWNPPTDNGGSYITGYRVYYAPTYPSNPTWKNSGWLSADTRTHTVSGLTYGRGYIFRVQARNAAGEGGWSPTAIATTPGPAPSQVRDFAAKPADGSIALSWEPPFGNSQGDTVTGYLIRYKKSSESSYGNSDTYISGTRHTVSGLRNGTAYDFEVRAVTAVAHGAPRTIRSTPDKSPTVAISGLATSIMWAGDSDAFAVEASSLDPSRSYTIKLSTSSNGILKLNSCAMGDDSYLSQIKAKSIALKLKNILVFACALGTDTLTAELIENGKSIANATQSVTVEYIPEILGVEPRPLGKARVSWTPIPNATRYILSMTGTESKDLILDSPASETVGGKKRHYHDLDLKEFLADDVRDTFKVKAVKLSPDYVESRYSSTVHIVDNPMIRADGDSGGETRGKGRAKLKWKRESGSLRYTIRYREMADHYNNRNWNPGNYGKLATAHPSDLTSHTLTGLVEKKIYAIQINYETSNGEKVYSGRDAFVWPSRELPGIGEKVATYPYFGHWSDRTYRYRICEGTFPQGDRANWVNTIEHAFKQWETATDGLVTVIREKNVSCWATKLTIPFFPMGLLVASVSETINEVYMVDNSNPLKILISLFTQHIDNPLGICVFGAPACTIYFGYVATSALGGIYPLGAPLGVDILFAKNSYIEESHKPQMPDSIRFNQCLNEPDNYYAFRMALHESGHALGTSGFLLGDFGDEDATYRRAHPTIARSVMNYHKRVPEAIGEPDCFPHPNGHHGDIRALSDQTGLK